MDDKQKFFNDQKKDREIRGFQSFELQALGRDGMTERPDDLEDLMSEMYIEGYALTFNQPTVLFTYEDQDYYEVIDRNALAGTDMRDVILNYDHAGKVMARTRNKTLELRVDDKGLYIKARLDGTEEGRCLYEEIKGGYIDRMSFSFVASDALFNPNTRTRTIKGIKKIYDVSAVSIPAYDSTSIMARSLVQAEAEYKREVAEATEKRQRLILLTQI